LRLCDRGDYTKDRFQLIGEQSAREIFESLECCPPE
jgi:hypothetical protein